MRSARTDVGMATGIALSALREPTQRDLCDVDGGTVKSSDVPQRSSRRDPS
ncbi:hypothetical protein [Streptomyces sp. NPDC056670]|uniref:hypothetical protein n=1 Tax=Streptomyces sp. NPDC056670 TaxID=3345904 RepID=UPI0036C7E30D